MPPMRCRLSDIHRRSLCLAAVLLIGCTALAVGQSLPSTQPDQPSLTPLVLNRRPVEQGLGLDEQQRRLLEQVFDHSSRFSDPALAVLLARAAEMAPLSLPQLRGELDLVAYRNLLNDPSRYRARPIRLVLQAARVRRMQEQEIVPWPRQPGQDLWWLECFDATTSHPQGRPLILLSIAEPPLPKGKDDGQGGQLHPNLPSLEAAATLYKIYSTVDRDGQSRDYPLLLSWQLLGAQPEASPGGMKLTQSQVMMLVGLMIMLLFSLMFYRRNLRRVREADEAVSYQPRRWRYQQEQQARPTPDRPSAATDQPPADQNHADKPSPERADDSR